MVVRQKISVVVVVVWMSVLALSSSSSLETSSCEAVPEATRATTSSVLGHKLVGEDLRQLDAAGAARILAAVSAYGAVVAEASPPLTRAEQVALSAKLGEVVLLPPSFEGLDPEPGEPAIQRVTNYWANGTWKGKTHSFGSYWHQDGQFWPRAHRWILSVLSCAAAPAAGGETGFADLREAFRTLDPALRRRAENATMRASVRSIQDFVRNAVPAEIDLFDDVEHPLVDSYPGAADDQDLMLYVGSPHMRLSADQDLLPALFHHAARFTYFHRWKPGDVVFWDNTITLHKAFSYDNTPDVKRELYRTQLRRKPTPEHLAYFAHDASPPRWLNPDGSLKYLHAT